VPAISLSKGKIDEAKKRAADPRAMGIRMPPTAGPRGPGQNNL
jgi:dual specificity phosphatase 12